MNKSDVPNKVVLDFSKDNTIKLSSKKNKIEKVKKQTKTIILKFYF